VFLNFKGEEKYVGLSVLALGSAIWFCEIKRGILLFSLKILCQECASTDSRSNFFLLKQREKFNL